MCVCAVVERCTHTFFFFSLLFCFSQYIYIFLVFFSFLRIYIFFVFFLVYPISAARRLLRQSVKVFPMLDEAFTSDGFVVARIANVGILAGVAAFVFLQIARIGEGALAEAAQKRLVAGVDAFVTFDAGQVARLEVAETALVLGVVFVVRPDMCGV